MPDALQPIFDGESRVAVPRLRVLAGVPVLTRAAVVALGLGTMLTLVNQGGALFGAGTLQLLPLVLVYVTPFVVVAFSQILGMRRASLDAARGRRHAPGDESFVATALGHGIPLRALLLGLLVGTFNGALLAGVSYLEDGHPGAVPWALLGQAYSLPAVFGVLTQAIAYRRVVRRLRPGGRSAHMRKA